MLNQHCKHKERFGKETNHLSLYLRRFLFGQPEFAWRLIPPAMWSAHKAKARCKHIPAIVRFGQTKCSYHLWDAVTSATPKQRNQVNKQWVTGSAEAARRGRALASGGTGLCQGWHRARHMRASKKVAKCGINIFLKILSLLVKWYSILFFFLFNIVFLLF